MPTATDPKVDVQVTPRGVGVSLGSLLTVMMRLPPAENGFVNAVGAGAGVSCEFSPVKTGDWKDAVILLLEDSVNAMLVVVVWAPLGEADAVTVYDWPFGRVLLM